MLKSVSSSKSLLLCVSSIFVHMMYFISSFGKSNISLSHPCIIHNVNSFRGEGTTIRESYQAYVHILNVRQTAFARNIEIVNNNALGLLPSHGAKLDSDGIVLRPGSRAKVRFEFAKRPEYIRPGKSALVLFCCVLYCVQYEDSATRILHLNSVGHYVIAFARRMY